MLPEKRGRIRQSQHLSPSHLPRLDAISVLQRLSEQKQPSLVIGILADYLSGCPHNRTCCKSCSLIVVGPREISQLATTLAPHPTPGRQEKFQERELMNTQDALFNGDQHMSDNGQEQSLRDEESGTRIDALGTGESTSPAQIPHHSSCCCISCWPKNMTAYL